MTKDEVSKEYEKLVGVFRDSGAEELKLKICDALVLECARAKIQLNDLNKIAERTGLVKVHPDRQGMQKSLPVATEITKVRASLTNMLGKLDKMLCVNTEDDYDDLDEFE